MTTIVFRDGVLAADQCITHHDVTVGHRRKIAEVQTPGGDLLGWIACSGWPSDSITIAKWLTKWPEIGEAPKRVQDGDTSGVFLMKSGDVWIIAGGAPFQMEMDFHATGTGFEIAMGALAMGATAEKAVEIASKYDQSTGGGVDTVGTLTRRVE